MVIPTVDHDCALKGVITEQANRIAKLEHEIALLRKQQHGPKSERKKKLPRVAGKNGSSPEAKAARRAERAKAREEMPTETVEHRVPDEQRSCPHCGNDELTPLGEGKTTTLYDFVPARFVRREHVQEVLRCKCNGYVVTAPGPAKLIDKGQYGFGFAAHLVVAKCADHMPLYRVEKDFERQGVPVARSTMNEVLHRASELLQPIWRLILERVRMRHVVLADETSMRMQDGGAGKAKTGFVWTFVGADDDGGVDVALLFAPSRSGDTPRRVLIGTDGYLVADAYAGYDDAVSRSGRIRVACHAHLRRRFYEAVDTAPVAQRAMDLIGELYAVEHEARDAGLGQTNSKLEFRRQRAGPIRERLKAFLDEEMPKHPPQSPIGKAVRYGLNQWTELGRFLDDPRVPLDNNQAESALRRIALGRKNFLFVGDVEAGESIAGLYTIIATCEARGVNPYAYLVDVLARVQDHPADRVHELLPGSWAQAT